MGGALGSLRGSGEQEKTDLAQVLDVVEDCDLEKGLVEDALRFSGSVGDVTHIGCGDGSVVVSDIENGALPENLSDWTPTEEWDLEDDDSIQTLDDGTVEECDLEKGDDLHFFLGDMYDPIQFSEGVLYPCPPCVNVEYGLPESIVGEYIDPKTMQRSLIFELDYPLLFTDREEDGEIFPDMSDSIPDVTHEHHYIVVNAPPYHTIDFKEYHYIIVDAPPYHTIGFKVTNVQILRMKPKWDEQLKKFSLEVRFRGPDND